MIAAFVQGPLLRVIPVGLVLLALQRTIFLEVRVFGVVVQVVFAFAAAAGVAGGSERGAVVGFVIGLMYDLIEATPFGSTAIAMTLGAAVAGLLALITVDPRWWLAALFTSLGTVVGILTVPIVRLFIGEKHPFDVQLYTIVPVCAVAAAVLSPILVPIARWCLRIKKSEWKAPPRPAEDAVI